MEKTDLCPPASESKLCGTLRHRVPEAACPKTLGLLWQVCMSHARLEQGDEGTVRIYVGNMPYNMNDSHLRELFEPYGQVNAINIITDRETGRPRGFGFVEMIDETEGRKAIESLGTHVAEGRPLNINEAKPREPRGGGGGRPGNGGRERW